MSLQVIIDIGHTSDYAREHPCQFSESVWQTQKGKEIAATLGFNRSTNDSVEHMFNIKLSNELKYVLNSNGIDCIVVDKPNLSNNSEISQVINEVNAKKPKLLISIHANAAGVGDWKNLKGKASGSVVLYYPTSKTGKRIATDIASQLKTTRTLYHGPDNRADHVMESSVAVLKKTNCPAVLVEACFYDNIEDLHWTVMHINKIANAILAGIRSHV